MLQSEIVKSRKITLIVAFATAACQPSQDSKPASLFSHPHLEASQRTLRLDPIPFGESREAFYTLTNTSSKSVFIRRVGPTGCSCASVREIVFDHRPPSGEVIRIDPSGCRVELLPGEEAQLRLVLDTSRYREPISRSHGSVPVWTEGEPRALLLEWSADIWTPFWVEPWAVQLGSIGALQGVTGSVSVQSHDTNEFDILVPAEMHGWQLTKSTITRGESLLHIINFKAPKELPLGPLQQEFILRSDIPDSPPIKFWVQALVEPSITWSPRRILLLPGEGRAAAKIAIFSRNPDTELMLGSPTLTGFVNNAESIHIEEPTKAPQKQKIFKIQWQGALPKEDMEGWLSIDTNQPDFPSIQIPLLVIAQQKKQ